MANRTILRPTEGFYWLMRENQRKFASSEAMWVTTNEERPQKLQPEVGVARGELTNQ